MLEKQWKWVIARIDAVIGLHWPTEAMRRHARLIAGVLLVMCIPGLLYLVHFIAIDIGWMAVAVAMAITTCLTSLLWLRYSQDPVTSGVIGVSAFTCLLTISAYSTGGFYGPNFAWLYVIPVFAALLGNMRAGAIFTGIVLLIAAGFWFGERNGLPLENLIPENERDLRSLADRGGAILVIGVALVIIASQERLGNRKLSDAYNSLKVEMQQREQLHDRMIHTERLASMGKLSAAVAHEINNPMTYVIGNLQVLQEPDEFDTDEYKELVSDALDGARRVSALVKDMQVYTRTPKKIRLDDVDITAALDTAAKMVSNRLRYCAKFKLECEPGLRARASEAQLVQVIVNLLTNAIDAIEGTVEENEIALIALKGEEGISIEVRDTGEGISEEVQKKLFEPFFTTKDIGQGTGMGLAISRSLIKGMGGCIHFTSTPSQGTTFSLVLPAVDVVEPEDTRDNESRLRANIETSELKILIIDDDQAVLRTIHRMLDKQDVHTEDDAKRALVLCNEEEFDLILCDIMMPSMSGDKFYSALIAAQPTMANRVTFMTGGVLTPSTEEFLASTDRPVLQKPLDMQDLRAFAGGQRSPESGLK